MTEGMLTNMANKTNIKSFSIIGLFGRYDINLDFDKEVNIYVGENGLGKTTILKCMYCVLNKKISLLENVEFSRIEVIFKRGAKKYFITKGDVLDYNRTRGKGADFYEIEDLVEYLLSETNISVDELRKLPENEAHFLLRESARRQGISPSLTRRCIYQLNRYNFDKNIKGNRKNVSDLNKAVGENIKEKILYLPTYRRIENDFSVFGMRDMENNNPDRLIQFGMSDVQESIDEILQKIRELAVQGYNQMSGLLLKQYAYADENEWGKNKGTPIDADAVKIVLNRLGNQISRETKDKILDIVESKDVYEEKYAYLQNLLNKLISNYDDQRHYDERINGFVDTCNKYLVDKKFRYDPSSLTQKIYMDGVRNQQKVISLTQLSSGEKQIVSLFSKMYLECEEKNIVIIDEPELSLSLKWQQMLLPDIMRSGNCNLLITVTHSPFIFENEFDMDAKEIRMCMTIS